MLDLSLKRIVKLHPNQYVIARITKRDWYGKARRYEILRTVFKSESVEPVVDSFINLGATDLVVIDTGKETDERMDLLPPRINAMTFRNFYGVAR